MALKHQGREQHNPNEDCYSKRPLLPGHDSSSYTRSQNRTYQNATPKKTITSPMNIRSSMPVPPSSSLRFANVGCSAWFARHREKTEA
jgi:hypothetical protein